MPRKMLARITQPQFGAQISSNGTGNAANQPATRTGLRPKRSDSGPATTLVRALVTPKATMKVRAAVTAVRWNTCVASSDSSVRSCPTMPPTSALTPTRRLNWARLARSPRRSPGGRSGPGRRTRSVPDQGPAGGPMPVLGTAEQDAQLALVLVLGGAGEEAGSGHGALAVPAHHRQGPAGSGEEAATAQRSGQRAQLDRARPGQMARGDLGALAHIQDRLA